MQRFHCATDYQANFFKPQFAGRPKDCQMKPKIAVDGNDNVVIGDGQTNLPPITTHRFSYVSPEFMVGNGSFLSTSNLAANP